MYVQYLHFLKCFDMIHFYFENIDLFDVKLTNVRIAYNIVSQTSAVR